MPDHTYSVSREELERLRRQVGDLKGQPLEAKHTATLVESMDRLHEALTRLIVIFENANREMAEDAARGIHDEHAKLDRVLEQNEKIARAVVQLADIVKSQQLQTPLQPAAQPRLQTQNLSLSPSSLSLPVSGSMQLPQPQELASQRAMDIQSMPTGLGADLINHAVTPPVSFPPPRSYQTTPQVEVHSLTPRMTQPTQVFAPTLQPVTPSPVIPSLPPFPATRMTPTMSAHSSVLSGALPPESPPSLQSLQAPHLTSTGMRQQMPSAEQFVPGVSMAAPMPPPDVRSTLSSPDSRATLPPPSMPGSAPRRSSPLTEQGTFVAQPVNTVQPAYATDGLGTLPPPPPPASKRGLLNRFSFS